MKKTIKVSENSHTNVLAVNIAKAVREHECMEIQAVGTLAVYLAIKGIARAIKDLKKDGIVVAFTPEYVDVPIDEFGELPIKMVVEPR